MFYRDFRGIGLTFSAILLLAVTSPACGESNSGKNGNSTSQTDEDSDDEDQINAGSFNCESGSFPCTFGEVDEETLKQSLGLGRKGKNKLKDGQSPTEVLEWLAANGSLAAGRANAKAVVFRLEGGRPIVLTVDGVFDQTADQRSQGLTPPEDSQNRQEQTYNTNKSPLDVVHTGEDRVPKKAKVVAPIAGDLPGYDLDGTVIDRLRSTRGYETIDVQKNDDVTVGSFGDWTNYDLVHVYAHGVQECKSGQNASCFTVIKSGIELTNLQGADKSDLVDRLKNRYSPHHGLALDIDTDNNGNLKHAEIGLTTDFFRNAYPSGLDDTVVYADACQTQKGDEFAPAVVGQDGTYFGWTETACTGSANATAAKMYEFFKDGLSTKQAREKVDELDNNSNNIGSEDDIPRQCNPPATLERYGGGDPLYVREIVSFRNPGSPDNRLRDKGTYPSLLAEGSKPGDGQEDEIKYALRIEGVPEDGIDGYSGKMWVNKGTDHTTVTKDLDLGEAQQQMDERTYRLEGKIDLGGDVRNRTPMSLEVRLDLPDSGKSVHRVEQIETEQPGRRITAGRVHFCLRNNDGTVDCWGVGEKQELEGKAGLGIFDENQALPPDGQFSFVDAALKTTCGLRSDGKTIECWGNIPGTTEVSADVKWFDGGVAVTEEGDVTGLSSITGSGGPPGDAPLKRVYVGTYACGLQQNGSATCWDTPSATGPDPLPWQRHDQDKPPAMQFRDLAIGGTVVCGIPSSGGGVLCWGREIKSDPIEPVSGQFEKVTGTHFGQFCALRESGAVICFSGKEECERAGDQDRPLRQDCTGDAESLDIGLAAVPNEKFRDVAVATHVGCGIVESTAEVRCWPAPDPDAQTVHAEFPECINGTQNGDGKYRSTCSD